jgi:hypothetical protein
MDLVNHFRARSPPYSLGKIIHDQISLALRPCPLGSVVVKSLLLTVKTQSQARKVEEHFTRTDLDHDTMMTGDSKSIAKCFRSFKMARPFTAVTSVDRKQSPTERSLIVRVGRTFHMLKSRKPIVSITS